MKSWISFQHSGNVPFLLVCGWITFSTFDSEGSLRALETSSAIVFANTLGSNYNERPVAMSNYFRSEKGTSD